MHLSLNSSLLIYKTTHKWNLYLFFFLFCGWSEEGVHRNCPWTTPRGRYGGLMVSALDSGARSPGLSPGWEHCLCSRKRYLTLTVPLSTQVYKWIPANCWGNLQNCGAVTCDGLASDPFGGGGRLATSCYRNQDKLWQQWASQLQGLAIEEVHRGSPYGLVSRVVHRLSP